MVVRIIITKEIDINRFPRSAESLFDDNGEPKVMSNEELATALKTEFNGGWIDALDIIEDADWKAEVIGAETTVKPLVTELNRTCFACPSQWEGCTEDGLYVYIRYRWGFLSAQVGNKDIYGASHGDGLHGYMDNKEMKQVLSCVLCFADCLLEED